MKTFYFNTGVKTSVYPKLSHGEIAINGEKHIPFCCEDVPENSEFKFACSDPDLYPELNYIVREMHNTTLLSKYAYFSKN